MITEAQKHGLINELSFSTSRSSGPGGQHVNKVNTKVELRFNITESQVFNESEKNLLIKKLQSRLTNEHILVIVCQASRSQLKNKNEAVLKFLNLLEKALTPIKKRKPTKPTLASKQKRINDKKIHSLKKNLRKNIDL